VTSDTASNSGGGSSAWDPDGPPPRRYPSGRSPGPQPGEGFAPGWDSEPGFEFDSRTRTTGRDPYSPGLFSTDEFGTDEFSADGFNSRAPASHSAHAEWNNLVRSLQPRPARRSRFAEFRAALQFRGAMLRVVVPILTMIVFGIVLAVVVGANDSHEGPAPPPAALGFAPAALAGGDFTAAATGRGISQQLTGVASNGAEIVAVGAQQGARIARAQFFVSTDDGRSWAAAAVRAAGGGPPPPGSAARFVAAGPGGWVAIGPKSIWTSPDGRTWTLVSTAGLPLRPGDQVSVLQRTAAGFLAAGANVTDGQSVPVLFMSADGLSWRRLAAGQTGLSAGPGRVLSIRYAAVRQNEILIAGDVAVPSRTAQATRIGAAWLSGDSGTTWTLTVPPVGHGARDQISGVAATSAGFVLTRPATVDRKAAVDVYRSAAGSRWTFAATVTAPAGFTATAVSGGPAGAVLSGPSGRTLAAFTSADGSAWRPAPALGPAASQQVSGLAVAQGGAVVAAGTITAGPTSSQPLLTVLPAGRPAAADRVNLTAIPGATDQQLAVNDVATANSQLVAVGSANGDPAVWVSPNGGNSWTPATGQTPAVLSRPGIGQLSSVTYGASGWLAVGGVTAAAPAHPLVLISGNGRVWTAADAEPAFTQPGLVTEQAAAPATQAGQNQNAPGYVIVGYQTVAGRTLAAAWYSTGLTGWQRAADAPDSPGALDAPGPSRQMRAVTAAPHGFVAVGADGNAPAAWTSADGGRTWTRQNVPLPAGTARAVLTQVASTGGALAAVGTAVTANGQQVPFAARSSDGATWTATRLPIPAGQAEVTALTVAGGSFWATGSFGVTPGHQDVVIWSSSTGPAWTAASPGGQGLTGPGRQAITALTASGRTLTGVGYTATPTAEQPVFWQSPVP
jgi:hypothetical protein